MGVPPVSPRMPHQGFAHQEPLRPLPPHLQRPAAEQLRHPQLLNPLDDLSESEKEYTAGLKTLLQRVSASWSQDDLPPREVDEMLRNIEDIYSANRKLSKRLSDVSASENVSKELGVVLIWFADAMETPYSNYCRSHVPHLDSWQEIANNSRLQNILTEIAAEQVQHVTLDSFFTKPIDRLHYYRRLYMRLLESSERGDSDFEALEAAFMKIDAILRLVTVDVPGTSRHPASPALPGISNMNVLRNALPSPPINGQTSPNFPPHAKNSISPALPPSPLSPGRSPNQRPQPSMSHPTSTFEAMSELERSLDTSKVLDLFTMQPKSVTLSLALIERQLVIRGNFCFTISTDDGAEERFEDGHILLLSDLLLMCRTKTPQEIDSNPEGNQSSFWLLFPPLAIRHVFASDVSQPDQGPIVEMSIVNRVKARIWVLEDQLKHAWIAEVNNAQQRDAAKVVPPPQAQSPPPHMGLTYSRSIRPMRPGSPMSPPMHGGPPPQHYNSGPLSPPFQGHPGGPLSPRPRPLMPAMGSPVRPPMGSPMSPPLGPPMGSPMSPPMGPGMPMSPPMGPPMSPPMGHPMGHPMGPPMSPPMGHPMNQPGFRPQMGPGGLGPRPSMMMHNGRPSPRPFNRQTSMRRTNTTGGRQGPPRGRVLARDDVTAREVLLKSKPCDVFHWKDENWEPLVEEDDCVVELRLTTTNRMAMAVTTNEHGQLVLNAWIVESTTFRRASECDISVSMDMGASAQWYVIALNSGREADEFCAAFQQAKDRAMYDPMVQKSSFSPVLSRGDSLAATATQNTFREKPVRQTLNSMYPPSDCKLFLQTGDHGQWVNLGSAKVEIKREQPSGYVRLFVWLTSGNKRVLESVIVQCDCLELVGPKKLAITLMNPQEKMSIIYMLQFKDETMTAKIFEGLSLNESS